jgi:hypothetical protein
LIKDKTYPLDSTEEFKKKMDRKAKQFKLVKGRLFTREKAEYEEALEVLHEGNIEEVILQVHKEGHFGVNNTWYKVKIQYWGPGLFNKVQEVVKNCETCQFRKKKPATRTVLARPISTPGRPFFMVGCDCIGPVIESNRGNKNIIVCVDYLTRWPIARAVPNINEETTAKFLFEDVVQYYGVPNFILTDRGSNFTSRYVKSFLQQINCRHLTTSAFRPQTNGLCERTNGTLVQALSKIVRDECDDVKDWDLKVPAALMALRTMKSEATGFTPGKLLYGFDIRTPGNWSAPRTDYVEGEHENEVNRRIEEIDAAVKEYRTKAREASNEKKKTMKERYDRTVQVRRMYKIGEQVLMKDQYPENKFADRWIGPMTVVKANESGTYHLVGPNSRRLEGAVNSDQLIPFNAKKSMIPDVQQRRKEGLFNAWIERREAQSNRFSSLRGEA